MSHFLTPQPVGRILELIQEFTPLGVETLPLSECLGRVPAQEFSAPENLPGFARATMDGYAVLARDTLSASEDTPALLTCIGECSMGQATALAVAPGQTARIWTGGMLPQGADAVVMLEHARKIGENEVELTCPAAPLDNIVAADEDAAAGQIVLPKGRILRPQEIGLLAAFGCETVTVHKKPRVAIISSGDEVVPINQRPRPGQVRDINSHALAALVTAAGGQAGLLGIAGDDMKALTALISDALAWADVILVSGGSSAGQRDYTVRAMQSVGAEILAHGVAVKPGKPLIMARKEHRSLWGLPGHTTGALICAEVFIRPLLRKLSGAQEKPIRNKTLKAVLDRSVQSAQGRRDYICARLHTDPDGTLTAVPIMGKSGLIAALVEADALIICPEDQEGLAADQIVDVLLF